MISSHVPFDPDNVQATVDAVGSLGEVGLDLAIVYLRPPLSPAVLTPLAEALSTVA